MPLLFALVASTLLHVAALVSPAWVLPGSEEPELQATTIDAVLARPPARVEPPPAKAASKPLPARRPNSASTGSSACDARRIALPAARGLAKAPEAVFHAVLDAARPHLTQGEWTKLARSLGLPPVDGLVAV